MMRILYALVLPLLACGGVSRPYYSGHTFSAPNLTERRRSELVQFLDTALKNHRAKRIEIRMPEQRVVLAPESPEETELDWLPLPALLGVKRILDRRHIGVELDFLTRTESGEYVAVTAQHEMDGTVLVQMGKPMRSLTENTVELEPEQLRALYGTGPVESGTAAWSTVELAALQQALATLSPQERAVLAGVRFVRSHRTVRPSEHQTAENTWGQYVVEAGQRTIYLYDNKSSPDENTFVGTPDKPLLASAQCLLHEIGHALADPYYADRRGESERGAVLSAYKDAIGTLRGPTPYGATDLGESFAESFSLFRADPDALSRVSPRIHEWFLADGHMKARQQP